MESDGVGAVKPLLRRRPGQWPVLILLGYAALLTVLAFPLCLFLGGAVNLDQAWGWWPRVDVQEAVGQYRELLGWVWFWVWIAVMVGGQAMLLAVPVAGVRGRPVTRRSWRRVLILTAFLFAVLSFLMIVCLCVAAKAEEGVEWIPGLAEGALARKHQLFQELTGVHPFGGNPEDNYLSTGILLSLALFWMGWGVGFLRVYLHKDSHQAYPRVLRRLFHGSVLELLVALPCHIVVRGREDCCAPAMTAFAIAAGLSLMLMTFGPGVVWLYADRVRRLTPAVGDGKHNG